jgi:hypothetical protein
MILVNTVIVLMIGGVVAFLVSGLYVKPALRKREKRRNESKELTFRDITEELEESEEHEETEDAEEREKRAVTVSWRTLEQLSHAFDEDEAEIIRAHRLSKVSFLPWVIFLGLVTFVLLLVSAYMVTHLGTGHYSWHSQDLSGKQKTSHLNVPWTVLAVIPVLIALFTAFIALNQWLRWRAYTLVITNKAVREDFQASPWFWWLWNDERHSPWPLDRIVRIDFSSKYWGDVWHYGNVDVVVLMQEGGDTTAVLKGESPPNNLRYVPHHEHFARDVSGLLIKIQQEEKEQVEEQTDLARRTAEGVETLVAHFLGDPRNGGDDASTEEWPQREPE